MPIVKYYTAQGCLAQGIAVSWYWIFALIFAVVLWNCFANFNVKSIFFLGKAKINHFYSDSNFQLWVLCCYWLFIYSIPIGLDAKKGKRVKDTRYSHITQMIWNLVVWITLTKGIHKIDPNYLSLFIIQCLHNLHFTKIRYFQETFLS